MTDRRHAVIIIIVAATFLELGASSVCNSPAVRSLARFTDMRCHVLPFRAVQCLSMLLLSNRVKNADDGALAQVAHAQLARGDGKNGR